MERRRSREHELRQPGSLLVIGPKLVLRTLLWCFVVSDFFLSLTIFFPSVYADSLSVSYGTR